MPFITANGVTTHFLELNPKGNEPVIMVHGLTIGTLAMWYFTTAPVLAERCRIVLYDIRGHGKSSKTKDGYDLKTMSDDLAFLINTLQLSRVSLVGYSYGSLICMKYAIDNPDTISKLCLIETPLPPSQITQMQEFRHLSRDEWRQKLPVTMQEIVSRNKRQAKHLLEHLQFLVTESTFIEDLKNEPDFQDEELQNLTSPVLGIYGEESLCIKAADRLEKLVPNITMHRLSGGHYLPFENTNEINKLLIRFISG